MRLRQLSRKLDVDTEKIIRHLQACNLPCEDDSNAKLSDEQVAALIEKFGPIDEVVTEEIPNTPIEKEEVQEEIAEPVQEVEAITEEVSEEPVSVSEEVNDVVEEVEAIHENSSPAEPEVIRAPKVELTGLKVVGKIELREPKKKEEEVTEENPTEEKPAQPKTYRERNNGRRPQKNKPQRKTLTIAEQRTREEKIKQRKKKEAEQHAKKKRKENYFKKVQTKQKTESRKTTIERPAVAQKQKSSENVGLFTRFINWMRRE